jgi:outer membrane lipoprotein SlyB
MRNWVKALVVVLACAIAVGCGPRQSSMSASTYSRDRARQVQTFTEGEVVMVREVMIEGKAGAAGAIAGGVMGYAVGNLFGGGRGRTLARSAGTVGGAAAGAAAQKAATTEKGLEITVRLDTGQTITIVQAADREFRVGDEVKVLTRPDGAARVVQ